MEGLHIKGIHRMVKDMTTTIKLQFFKFYHNLIVNGAIIDIICDENISLEDILTKRFVTEREGEEENELDLFAKNFTYYVKKHTENAIRRFFKNGSQYSMLKFLDNKFPEDLEKYLNFPIKGKLNNVIDNFSNYSIDITLKPAQIKDQLLNIYRTILKNAINPIRDMIFQINNSLALKVIIASLLALYLLDSKKFEIKLGNRWDKGIYFLENYGSLLRYNGFDSIEEWRLLINLFHSYDFEIK